MLRPAERTACFAVAALWLLLATSPARALLEASMVLHMLVQLPLLAYCGYRLGRAWLAAQPGTRAQRALALLQTFNAGGCSGLISASFVMLLWMLPRSLDLARLEPGVDLLKFICVSAAGILIALSWPRLPTIARAVVHLEVIATFLRFGWGYLAAEERLCLVYLAGDQQRTGELLLWFGAAYAVAVIWRPMSGVRAKPERDFAGDGADGKCGSGSRVMPTALPAHAESALPKS